MKNNLYEEFIVSFKHSFRIMRNAFLALFLLVGTTYATESYSQNLRVTVVSSGISTAQVLSEIESQTDYLFVYDVNEVDLGRKVNVDAENRPVSEVLDEVFEGTGITYAMEGKNIMLMKESEKESSQQQDNNYKRVRGIVIDANNEPIIGANVTVKEKSSIGTITDMDGRFVLDIPTDAVLQISFIGFASQNVRVGDREELTITLAEDSEMLDEVVVVGYGTQRKVDLTGSVARANIKAFQHAPNTSIVQSLQGVIPGLNIGQVNTAGGAANIQVRGQSTINGSQDVLIVLDGIIYNGTMASLNPADIESIDVLKDASSKAIYGASAANGVLLITTKKGKRQEKPTITFSATLASQSPTKKLHPMNREEKIKSIYDYYWEEAYLGPDYTIINPDFDVRSKIEATQIAGYDNGTDYNWVNNATQDSYYMNYQITISNATEKTNYFISAGYTKQDGYVKNDDFNRKNARINIETKIFDWFKIGTQAFGSFMNYSGASPDLRAVNCYSPLNTPYDEDGNLVYMPNGTLTNPFTALDASDRDLQNTLSAVVYASIDIPFIKGLNYRINWGNNYKWNQHYYSNKWDRNQTGYAYKNNSSTYDYTIDHILNYKLSWADRNHLDVTAVFGLRKQTYEYTTANGENYSDISLGYNSLEQAVTQKIGSDAWQEQYLYQMGRINYNYDNRYLVTATLRRDGYSGFSENNRFALFPSFALGWVISNEKFFNVKQIDNLKLRASWGSNGNMTSRYATMAQMGSRNYVFGDGGSTVFGQYVSSMASDLKWETTKGINVGFDLSLFKGRITATVDYYNNNTTNLLWNVNIPTITGFSSIATNIGKINNKGVEFTIGSDVVRYGGFNWNLTFNFSKNKNKIVELLGDNDSDGKEDDLIADGLFVGESINAVYDYNMIGMWQMGETPYSGTYVGCEKLEDLNNDGKIDAENDRKILGSKDPAYRFSIGSTFTYKNWSLFVFFNSVQGGKNGYLGTNNAFGDTVNNSGDNMIKHNFFREIDYWTPSNPNGEYRIPIRVPSISPNYWRDRSFVRLQDISLTYVFDKKLLSKVHIQDLSLSIACKNLFTWTKWKGWDPETGDGLNFYGYPVMKSYSIGLNLTF